MGSVKAVALIIGDSKVRGSLHFVQDANGLLLSLCAACVLFWVGLVLIVGNLNINRAYTSKRENYWALSGPPWFPYSRSW